jgi:predicted chitinase
MREMITEKQLVTVAPRMPKTEATRYTACLNVALHEASINTVTRLAAFLGQLLLESGEFKYMEEIADGSAYEGRKDLGNTSPGDGKRYKGRGPIQLTGRANYKACGEALGIPLEEQPHMAAFPATGFRVAAWYWTNKGLNAKADACDYRQVTKAVNGAATDHAPSHHLRRVAYYQKALEVLGVGARLDVDKEHHPAIG